MGTGLSSGDGIHPPMFMKSSTRAASILTWRGGESRGRSLFPSAPGLRRSVLRDLSLCNVRFERPFGPPRVPLPVATSYAGAATDDGRRVEQTWRAVARRLQLGTLGEVTLPGPFGMVRSMVHEFNDGAQQSRDGDISPDFGGGRPFPCADSVSCCFRSESALRAIEVRLWDQ